MWKTCYESLRPWDYAQSSKSKECNIGLGRLFNCRGSCYCKNIKSLNISDFGVNRVEIQKIDNQTIYSFCGNQAAFIPCTECLIL